MTQQVLRIAVVVVIAFCSFRMTDSCVVAGLEAACASVCDLVGTPGIHVVTITGPSADLDCAVDVPDLQMIFLRPGAPCIGSVKDRARFLRKCAVSVIKDGARRMFKGEIDVDHTMTTVQTVHLDEPTTTEMSATSTRPVMRATSESVSVITAVLLSASPPPLISSSEDPVAAMETQLLAPAVPTTPMPPSVAAPEYGLVDAVQEMATETGLPLPPRHAPLPSATSSAHPGWVVSIILGSLILVLLVVGALGLFWKLRRTESQMQDLLELQRRQEELKEEYVARRIRRLMDAVRPRRWSSTIRHSLFRRTAPDFEELRRAGQRPDSLAVIIGSDEGSSAAAVIAELDANRQETTLAFLPEEHRNLRLVRFLLNASASLEPSEETSPMPSFTCDEPELMFSSESEVDQNSNGDDVVVLPPDEIKTVEVVVKVEPEEEESNGDGTRL